MAAALLFICILPVFLGPSAQGAQGNKNKVEFLVARRQVQDPFFHESVVFMLPPSNTGLVVGLIINKPTRVTLGKLLPTLPEFKGRTDLAYFGGPVDVRIPSVVFRSPTAPEHATHLYGDVYLTFDADRISRAFQNPQPGYTPRLFLGRAQWSPAQLRNEIRQGGWYKVQAEGDLIFSHDPHSLWRTLHGRGAPGKYIRYQLPPVGPRPPAQIAAAM